MKRLTKTGIEYGDYGWNFYPGCRHQETGVCPVKACWAKGMAKRLKFDFSQPRLVPELLLAPLSVRKPSTILVNFMGDLGGEWVDPLGLVREWTECVALYSITDRIGKHLVSLRDIVFRVMEVCPQHTFLFLTKNPLAWQKWTFDSAQSKGVWPDNAWVGATAWDEKSYWATSRALHAVQAKHKWISFEPLFGPVMKPWPERPYYLESEPHRGRMTESEWLRACGIGWVVIGAQTRPDVVPKVEWVEEIVEAAGRAGIPVWIKNNLFNALPLDDPLTGKGYPFWTPVEDGDHYQLRQELPR